ncbi:tagaturonate reductase [Saccharicrinis fermentans]|uniref:Altronate oxidoreductase n=1 Tax=Saccharicrinis fermentans DSM 9555 = JCM 21142 TaxID=869213 RepID=W7YH98_9BACT|nr:tagaturonate reductase [Saccharicrinis fermentans]GAF03806.1 altronate oxidoreductase [Saccharicrinis fermentans DSM 9555 = JCM 21142]
MNLLNRTTYQSKTNYPFKVLQFGEGNFLRAFVDWMIYKMNKELGTPYGVVVVQPLDKGMVEYLQKQDNLYHVILQGVKDGTPIEEKELVDCIIDSVNPYTHYKRYQEYFLHPALELVVSNTTEAGISRIENEDIFATPPQSFPGKVCQLLYQRYLHFKGDKDKGLDFICCELIDKNATQLKEIVLELALSNHLEKGFMIWINDSCTFCSSLVDRIVPGFPKDNIEQIQKELGYKDNLVVMGEYFHLWAIEAPQQTREKYPFDKAGLNVVWLEDMTQFRDKKVRILNGSHTALVPIGLLSGYETVKEAFEDSNISRFIHDMVASEVIPNIQGSPETLNKFAADILERFYNPYIRHFLKDISLNSLSKWMTRDYPSLIDGYQATGKIPQKITFSLAALLIQYKGEYNGIPFTINDNNAHITFIQDAWKNMQSYTDLSKRILANKKIWNTDLTTINGLTEAIATNIEDIMTNGIQSALGKFIKSSNHE